MEQSLCLSNPHATGSRETLESVSSIRSGSVSSTDGNETCSTLPRSPFYVRLLKSGKFKSVLLFSVAVVALLAVWGAMSTLTIFYALPASLANGQNASSKANKTQSNETGMENTTDVNRGNNKTCYRLMRWDPLTNLCYIPCEDWEWRTESETHFRRAATYITIVVSIVCVLVMIITLIKLKYLWSFPLIVPFYALLLRAIFGLSVTIPIAFTRQAFCSDKNFTESLLDSTPFCIYSGAIRQYLLYASSFWLLLGFGNLWWIIVFATKGDLFFENKRKIYIIQSVVAWGFPVIGVVPVLTSDVRYSQSLTFPDICFPSTMPAFYYSIILPEQLFVGSSCTLLIWICYSLAKQIRRRSSATSDHFSAGSSEKARGGSLLTIERRFIVLLSLHSIFIIFTLMCYMLLARNHEVIASAFMQYQSCADSTPEADCIQLFRKYTLSRMMLAADFAWQTEIVVGPTIFLFAYKEVRNLWFSIITCGLHSRKTTVSRENAAQNGKKNIIPLIVVTQSATTEM